MTRHDIKCLAISTQNAVIVNPADPHARVPKVILAIVSTVVIRKEKEKERKTNV